MDLNNSRWGKVESDTMMEIPIPDWRTQLQNDSRQRIVNKIIDCLKRHLPLSNAQELEQIAVRCEDRIYATATSQSDYLRTISFKMLTMESKYQNTGLAANYQIGPHPASHSMQSEVGNQGQYSQQSVNQIPSQSTLQQTQPSMMQAATRSAFQQNQQPAATHPGHQQTQMLRRAEGLLASILDGDRNKTVGEVMPMLLEAKNLIAFPGLVKNEPE